MIKASKLCCANCVAPRNLPHGFACVAAADRCAPLVVDELRLPPHSHALCLSAVVESAHMSPRNGIRLRPSQSCRACSADRVSSAPAGRETCHHQHVAFGKQVEWSGAYKGAAAQTAKSAFPERGRPVLDTTKLSRVMALPKSVECGNFSLDEVIIPGRYRFKFNGDYLRKSIEQSNEPASPDDA